MFKLLTDEQIKEATGRLKCAVDEEERAIAQAQLDQDKAVLEALKQKWLGGK
jgi:hypothetical protein